jgi:hypothetical protein
MNEHLQLLSHQGAYDVGLASKATLSLSLLGWVVLVLLVLTPLSDRSISEIMSSIRMLREVCYHRETGIVLIL